MPLFLYPLPSVSAKEYKELVMSTWVNSDDDKRLSLSFVKKSDGSYIGLFNRSEFEDGVLERNKMLMDAVISKAGVNKFLFLRGRKPLEQDSSTSGPASSLTTEAVTVAKQSAENVKQPTYFAFIYEIEDDFLYLFKVDDKKITGLIKEGLLDGDLVRHNSWQTTVTVKSSPEKLAAVLKDYCLGALSDRDFDDKENSTSSVKATVTFKRK